MLRHAITRLPSQWGWLLGLAALALLLTDVVSRPDWVANHAAVPVAGEKTKDPLVELNNRFRAAYAHARKEVLAHQGPVIIADGDELILLRRGQRTAVNVTPASYHVVKAVSHVPLAIHVLLADAGEVELPEARLKELRGLREPLDNALKSLGDRGLPQDVLKVETQILQESAKFLDAVLADKKVKAEARLTFTRKLGPLLLTSARHAATVQLQGMHKQVMAWKREMTEEEWKQLRVLILGSALPRKDNLRTQYFARLFGEKGEGGRIIYTEGLFDEGRALNLLGTYQLDGAIGAAFFDDPARMHRDLLADAAAAHLKTMSFDRP
jgi:hypothetical protein